MRRVYSAHVLICYVVTNDREPRMTAHVIAFTIRRILKEASLIDLRDARKVADRVQDSTLAKLIQEEVERRLS